MERRRRVRYPLSLGCAVSSSLDRTFGGPGKTVNVSSCGVLVCFDRDGPAPVTPQVGTAARVVLELPVAGLLRTCRVECSCRVIRVEDQAPERRVAFAIRRYSFQPSLAHAPAGQLREASPDE